MAMIYYTSDLHFGHRLVAGLRGFDNTDDHDQAIISHWYDTVNNDDIVYVLGDLAINNPTRAIGIVSELPGRKRLIWGNHDFGHPMRRDAPRWTKWYSQAFEYTAPFGRRRINGRNVLLSHFPYTEDRDTARFMQYRLPDMGEYLLHGHLHSAFAITSTREIHVGWDAWHRLVTESDIETLIG
jgi:calcineurin-like phosphoesterase family protein